MVDRELERGLGARRQHALRALKPLLGLLEAAQPDQRHGRGREAIRDHWILKPAVDLGDPDRLLAAPKAGQDRRADPRCCDPEVAKAGDLEPRASNLTRQRQRLLEMATAVIEPR